MRFSPPCVVFAATIENESARARALRISFALGVFGYTLSLLGNAKNHKFFALYQPQAA